MAKLYKVISQTNGTVIPALSFTGQDFVFTYDSGHNEGSYTVEFLCDDVSKGRYVVNVHRPTARLFDLTSNQYLACPFAGDFEFDGTTYNLPSQYLNLKIAIEAFYNVGIGFDNVSCLFFKTGGAGQIPVDGKIPVVYGAASSLNSLVDNGNGSFTFTDNLGGQETIEVCELIDDGGCRPKINISANGETFEFVPGGSGTNKTYDPPFATTGEVNTALTAQTAAFVASQAAQDAQISWLQSGQSAAAAVLTQHDAAIVANNAKKRAWTKEGDVQATNSEDVDVSDNVFHLGKTFIGANVDDGTGRKLQVNGGISVNGDSKIGHFLTKTYKTANGYTKIFEFEDLLYQSFFLQLIITNDAGSFFESLINCRIHGDTYGNGAGFDIYNVFANSNNNNRDMPFGVELIAVKRANKVELWFLPTASDDTVSFIAQSTSLQGFSTVNFNFDETQNSLTDPVLGATVLYDSRNNNQLFTTFVKGNVGVRTTNPMYPLHVNGTVAASAFVTTSDERTKENIEKIENGGSSKMIRQLPAIVEFEFKKEYCNESNEGKRIRGFLANQMPKSLTQTVEIKPFERVEFDEKAQNFLCVEECEAAKKEHDLRQSQLEELHQENAKLNDGLMVIDLTQLLFTTAAALKETIIKNEKLEARIAKLEALIGKRL